MAFDCHLTASDYPLNTPLRGVTTKHRPAPGRRLDQWTLSAGRLETLRVERGSRAASDGRLRVGRYAWEMASTKLASASDHLQAWDRILSARTIPIFAQYTILRSALETGAVARWIVGPEEQTERIRRGVAAQRDDLAERKKFEDAGRRYGESFDPRGPGKPASVRLAELATLASKHKVKRLEVNVVEACRLFGRTGEDKEGAGEILYRLLSGATHGYQWVALPISDFEVHPGRVARLTVNPKYTLAATAMVIDVFVAAVREVDEYATEARQ